MSYIHRKNTWHEIHIIASHKKYVFLLPFAILDICRMLRPTSMGFYAV
jgi:hypothetical protein